jgi:hypothetical protein
MSGSQQGSQSYSGPTYYQQQYQKDILDPFFRESGLSNSPWYGQLSQMYKSMLEGGDFKVPTYASDTIEEMVSTGSPFNQSEAYASAKPVFQRDMNEAMAAAKESSGQAGQLRSSGGYQALGEAAAGSAEDFNKYLTDLASSSWESAQARRLGAIPYAFQEQAFGPDLMATLTSLGTALNESQYPFLPQAMQYSGAGQGISVGDSYGKTGGCSCRIFTEDWTKELALPIQEFRDKHFDPSSCVSAGYKMMSGWLVPSMMKNKVVRWTVRKVMLSPLSSFAKNHRKKDHRNIWSAPFGLFWVGVWAITGWLKERRNLNAISC